LTFSFPVCCAELVSGCPSTEDVVVEGLLAGNTKGPEPDNDVSCGITTGTVGRPKYPHHGELGGCADVRDEIDAAELAAFDGESTIISAEISRIGFEVELVGWV
jgi:hypothetical protein